MPIQVSETTAPAAWASALINDDRSGLSDAEERALDAWLAQQGDWYVVDVKRDASGEPEGSRFTWSFRLYGGEASGGDVIDYVIHRVELPRPLASDLCRALRR